MKIGEKIKAQRLAKNWTQEQLANLLNVSRSTVSSWEVERNYPDLEMIVSLSQLFEISLDNLLGEDSKMVAQYDKYLKKGRRFNRVILLICLPILVWGLLLVVHQLLNNELSATLLFFGTILLVFLMASSLIVMGISSILNYVKESH